MPAAELMKLDKEKLIARIRNAGTPKEAVPVLEAEIDRILASCVAAEENPRLSEMLSFILRTVRMTVRSADCVKEVRAFEEKTGGRGKQGRSSALPLILLAVGIALIAALFLIAAAAGGFVVSIKLLPVYILLAAGGGAPVAEITVPEGNTLVFVRKPSAMAPAVVKSVTLPNIP